jgi:hypothetical protein
MIEVTPFYNPFKRTIVRANGKTVELVEKNGKVYKKITKEK